ncbi:MAG: Hpt domain-containing protein [SAR324 cluster bacterium]|nr:Hpt domain-containing protein [SAR324 cluster bacterium]
MDFREDEDVIETFIEETLGHLEIIQNGIMSLEKQGQNTDDKLIHQIFREAHTMKAGANLLELKNIERLAHHMEDILDLIRKKQVVVDKDLVGAFLHGLDTIRDLLDDIQDSDIADITVILQKIKSVIPVSQ